MTSVRRWLLAGLLVLVPFAITLGVLNWIVATLDQTLLILPESWHPDKLLGFHIPGFGVLLTLAIVLSFWHRQPAGRAGLGQKLYKQFLHHILRIRSIPRRK